MKKQTQPISYEKHHPVIKDEMQRLAHLGCWEFDLPANRLVWSGEVSRIFGLEAQESEATYEDFLSIIHPEDRAGVDAAFHASVQNNQDGFESEHRILRANSGEIRYVQQKCLHERNLQGSIIRSTGIVQDITERKQAEADLKQARANMQAIIENTLDNIWAINTHYEILYTNDVFARAFQAVFGVLLTSGVNLLNALPAAIRPVWKERYDRAFNGERFVFVDTIDMGDIQVHVEVAVNPIVHEGRVVGASFFGRDVTARKQGEHALEVMLAKYKTLFEAFPLGISVTDETGKILETNTIAEQLLALPQAEHTRRTIDSPTWHIIREDGTPMPSDEYASVRALNEKRVVENVCMGILKPDETVTWLNVTAAPLPVPGYGVVVTYGDITAQKQMEGTLRVKEWAILDSINAIALSDLAGNLTFVNPAFLKMWGYSSDDEVLGRNAAEFWQSGGAAVDVIAVLRQQKHWRGELLGKRQDGSRFMAEVSGSLILGESGRALSLLGVFEDISERKQDEQILQARLNLSEFAQSHSPGELLQKMLDEAEALTDSQIGFFHFVDDDQISISLQAWSSQTIQKFCTADGNDRHYALDQAGVWADCVREQRAIIHNDYAALAQRRGLPEGHTAVIREVTVPVIRAGKIVAVAGLGNKAENYTDQDVEILTRLTDMIWDIAGRKHVEESLRASEKKYRQLSSLLRLMADTMPDMLWAKNLNKEFIFANQSVCENLLNAVDTEEPLGKTDLFFATREREAHPEAPDWHTFGELCQDSDAITLQAMKPMQFDEFGNVKGKFLYLEVHKAPLYDDDGQLFGVVGSARNVTARKEAEEVLRKSAERAQLQRNALARLTLNKSITQNRIPEALKEISVMISEVLQVARASVWLLSEDQAWLECLMLWDADHPHQAGKDILKAADFPRYFEALQQESVLNVSDARSDPRTSEFAGHYLPAFNIGALLDAVIQRDGRMVGVVCAEHIGAARTWYADESLFLSAVSNFTAQLLAQAERRRAEEALRASEERYRSLFTRTLDGVYRSTHAGKFIDINPAMVKMFGYASPEEMLKIDIQKELYFDPTERGSHILDTGEVGHETYRMRRKDGSEIWVEDHGSYIHDEHGNIIFHEGVLRDVTERKQAELRILQLNSDLERRVKERTAQLEAANHELESFSYSVSHDLRAPLRSIDGFSRILSEEYAGLLPDEGQVLLERVCASATRMGALIDDLLKFSRLGRQALRTQLVDMNALVQMALATLQAEMESQPPQITIQPLPGGQGDPSLLIQVWVNLLSNAIKYSRKRADAHIEIGCCTGEGEAHVYYIRDNGVGFDMRYADKLFGVFQRLHSESEFKGTGVGLALVHRIISRHGGRIWAESEMGRGATFYFTLGEG